jgi:hypothetical protein
MKDKEVLNRLEKLLQNIEEAEKEKTAEKALEESKI